MSFSEHTFGSLFAGVGGFDMGFERAGWDCKFQVEWDKHCQQILARHWPDVPRWSDVSDTKGYELPPVDCIIFGSPCQDLSVAGKRAGLDGERSGLFHEAMRVIKEMRDATNGTFPRWIVWENVAGALSSNKGLDFGRVLDEMAEAGAVGIEWVLLDAQHFGVPQRRRRVFVVACFDPATLERCPNPLLPVPQSMPRDSQKGRKKGKATTGEVGASLASGGEWWRGGQVADTLTATSDQQRLPDKNRMQVVTQPFTGTSHAQYGEGVGTIRAHGGDLGGGSETLLVEPFVKSRRPQSSTDDETWIEGEVAPTLKAFDVGDTRATTAIVGSLQARDHKGLNHEGARDGKAIIESTIIDFTHDSEARFYDEVSPTLQARMGTGGNQTPCVLSFDTQFGSNADVFEDHAPPLKASQQSPSVQEHMAVRRLTPVECERLMGWPDDHTRWKADGTEQSDTHRYKQCGNGVASPVAQWIAEHMIAVDTTTDTATNTEAQ